MSETTLRLGMFAGVLAIMAIAEMVSPWRERQDRAARWPSNLGVVVVDTLLLRLLLPVSAAGLALIVEARGWGLFHWLGAPYWPAFVLAMVLLDLAIYAQHVVFHHVPWLWRLHRMHHADTVIDVTTGLRFHPIEILISMAWKFALVLALGIPAAAVIGFEVVLNAGAMFSHANVRLPQAVDRWLRLVIVTPDMHRVHHSTERAETDSNFGFNLAVWDRMFGTYIAAPKAGLDGMETGLGTFRDPAERRLDRLLTQPFRND